MRIRSAALAAAVLLAGGVVTAGSVTANAAPAQELASASTRVWQNVYTGRCLDDSATYGLRTISCTSGNTNTHQQWLETDVSAYVETLKNVNTGRCIDDSDTFGLRTTGCTNNNLHQQFYEAPDTEYYDKFQSEITYRCWGLHSASTRHTRQHLHRDRHQRAPNVGAPPVGAHPVLPGPMVEEGLRFNSATLKNPRSRWGAQVADDQAGGSHRWRHRLRDLSAAHRGTGHPGGAAGGRTSSRTGRPARGPNKVTTPVRNIKRTR